MDESNLICIKAAKELSDSLIKGKKRAESKGEDEEDFIGGEF